MKTTIGKGKTGRKCLLCTHPQREALNEAISMGKATMSQIADKIGVNKSSVSRHFRRHLQPAMVAAGGGATLAWNVRGKSRELTERMESLFNILARDGKDGESITKGELLESWQAIKGLGSEMREWTRLHGQATGELARDSQNTQTMQIQIVCPSAPRDQMPQVSFVHRDAVETDEDPIAEIGLLQI